MNKIISMVLAITICVVDLVLLNVTASNEKMYFDDIGENEWYYDEVNTVYEAGIMEGKSSNIFDPSANMSRAEFVTVLCRLSNESYEGKGNNLSFLDTDKKAWYADYVAWGVESEMVKGLPGNKFAPHQEVSRQEMAVFIGRFVSYMNIELSENSNIITFADSSQIADYAKDAVDTMRKSGIISGDENGYFNPTASASRAEVATVITRILPLLDGVNIFPDPVVPEITGEFVLHEEEQSPLPYYIYLPEDYDTNTKYPLVVFSHKYGDMGIDTVDVLFSHQNSPVYESIVIVPKTAKISENKKLDELIEYVKECYSTDDDRVYMIALNDDSTYDTWLMLLEKPKALSAVIFVYGISASLTTRENGEKALMDDVGFNRLPNELKDIPISIIHCTDDPDPVNELYIKNYGNELYSALTNTGFEHVILTQPDRYSTIYEDFVNEDDMSQLEWLFAQHRETK